MERPRPRPWPLVSLVVLAGVLVASLWAVWPPAAVGADAPDEAFSAQRAFAHVERIARDVHPAGSDAAAQVRDDVVDTLTGLGLEPEVHDGVGATGSPADGYGLANVRNVVATIPGTDPSGTLFLVAHYDSVQVSYGASDDGVGVATLLETARAVLAGPALRDDVVLLFTDAEEACLCGAEAFVTDDEAGAAGGVVLNLEARGSSGPAIMFQTARGNAALVERYAGVPYPVGSSVAVEVYRILPNDTDFTPFLDAGRFTGLNSAYTDGSAAYHSPQDRPANLDLRSLQQHGSNALALVRSIGDGDVAALAQPSAQDSTYFPLPGLLVRYPGSWTWPLAAASLLAVLALAVAAVRRRRTGVGRLVVGFVLGVVPIALAVVGAQLLWSVLVAIRPGYGELLDPWRPWWFRGGLVALVAAVVLAWFAALRSRVGGTALVVGGLGWLAVLGVVLAAATPGGSYLTTLPALAGALAGLAGLARSPRADDRPLGLLPATLAAAVAVLVLAPIVLLFFPALGLATGAAPALFAVLLGLALLPVLDHAVPSSRRAALPALGAFVVAVACVGVGLVVDRFDDAHPEPTQLMYALDADTRTAWWASQEATPSAWTSRYVGAHEDLSRSFAMLPPGVWTGAATAADLPAPRVTVVTDRTAGGQRTLTVRIEPQREVRLVDLSAGGIVRAVVEGRDVPVGADGAFHATLHAPGDDGVELQVTVAAGAEVQLRVADGSDGLGGLPGFVARPSGVGIAGSHTSELVLVGTTATL